MAKLKALKLKRLERSLRSMRRVVIAYSGGLDSTFLLKTAVDSLGRENVLAVTARSETYPLSEYREAKRIAGDIGARHITIYTGELALKKFRSNPVNRCYYCKKELFKKLNGIKRRYRMNAVIDGTNKDDLRDVRFGMRAGRELNVRSPLLESGITKDDIRMFSRDLGLDTHDKPSFACLASRVPFGSRITEEDLARIDRAESILRNMGFRQVRLRLHGRIARIEIFKNDFDKAVRLSGRIARELKGVGFVYSTLDLEGYRTGSMHEGLVAGTGFEPVTRRV